jgi:hypothetical protein
MSVARLKFSLPRKEVNRALKQYLYLEKSIANRDKTFGCNLSYQKIFIFKKEDS